MLVDTIDKDISACEIREKYINRNKAVLVKGFIKHLPAFNLWGVDYFKTKYGSNYIQTKKFKGNGEIILEKQKLNAYLDEVVAFQRAYDTGVKCDIPAYWHDVPILELFKDLISDLDQFDTGLLPRFYQKQWHRYVQFFMSAPGSITKLHFDTLRTHNIFFQVLGKKRWILVDGSETQLCARKKWRWFDVDPENPDYEKFPLFKKASPCTVDVEAGDFLYIPPGTLHHVRSIDTCISFNIDFHTPSSVANGFKYLFKGMPKKVIYYNFIIALGLLAKFPERMVFPFYRSYLNFVS